MTTTTDGLSCGTCGHCMTYSPSAPACNPWANIYSAIVRLHMQEHYGICDVRNPSTVQLTGTTRCAGAAWVPRR